MALNARAAKTGNLGEDFTAKYLEKRHYKILDRNWRIREGEIDLVALSPEGEIVFVEVKTRSSTSFGDPLESISDAKIHRVQRLALAWLATHQKLGARYRIDVAGVLFGRSAEITIDYRMGIL